jgi:hypothetical protein
MATAMQCVMVIKLQVPRKKQNELGNVNKKRRGPSNTYLLKMNKKMTTAVRTTTKAKRTSKLAKLS